MSGPSEHDIERAELRWAWVVAGVMTVIFAAVTWAAMGMARTPPSNGALIDPITLHLSPEFGEANLGVKVEPGGAIVARVVAAQFQFTPACIEVPVGKPVTLRFSSPDVIHGVLITGSNVNTMVMPGYVSQVKTVFQNTGAFMMPCHEFCGLGHGQMMATVRVVPQSAFKPGPDGRVACADR
jgi:cytochrome c oxidase subunit 2